MSGPKSNRCRIWTKEEVRQILINVLVMVTTNTNSANVATYKSKGKWSGGRSNNFELKQAESK